MYRSFMFTPLHNFTNQGLLLDDLLAPNLPLLQSESITKGHIEMKEVPLKNLQISNMMASLVCLPFSEEVTITSPVEWRLFSIYIQAKQKKNVFSLPYLSFFSLLFLGLGKTTRISFRGFHG